MLVVVILIGLLVARLRRGPAGRMLLAIRSNERAAGSVGINVAQAKLMAFALAAFIAGVGGALTGYQQGELTADSFAAFTSIGLLAIVFVAGVGRIAGAVVAGVMFAAAGLFVTFLDIHLSVGQYQAIVAGVALVMTAVQNPDGLTSTATGKGPAVALRRCATGSSGCARAARPSRLRAELRSRTVRPLRPLIRRPTSSTCTIRLPDAPSRLRVEHLSDAVGIGITRPRLSWWLPEGAREQVEYRIRADNGWDTGPVQSADTVLVEYAGAPLSSGARVAWQVRVWTDLGESDWSSPDVFEVGLLEPGTGRRCGSSRPSPPSGRLRGGDRRCSCAARSSYAGSQSCARDCMRLPTGSTRRSSTAGASATPS